MVAHTPSWSEARCPISPNSASYASASSDNNQYPLSPALSPGSWNVASPSSSMASPMSYNSLNSSVAGTPLSAPAALATQRSVGGGRPPQIPKTIGNQERPMMSDTDRRIAMEKINKRFIGKTSFDQEREKSAIRKANMLMDTEIGRSKNKPEKKILITNRKPVGRVVIIPDGREHMASSTWKDKKAAQQKENQQHQADGEGIEMQFEEHVDDYKCEYDRDREKWAFRHALKLLKIGHAKNFV